MAILQQVLSVHPISICADFEVVFICADTEAQDTPINQDYSTFISSINAIKWRPPESWRYQFRPFRWNKHFNYRMQMIRIKNVTLLLGRWY